ncbi:MAG TPA: cytochrome P450 [Aeromicrobium sp.]|nr:cytochrome P450 [Aeromicrobium sp.]
MPAPARASAPPTQLPPGPTWPDLIQAIATIQYRPTVMRRLHARYGDVFSVRMPYGPHGSMVTVVLLADPEHIREVFAGPTDVFHAGEGNAALLDVMGEHSLLLLDEEGHVRAKRLLMPAFTARAMDGYRAMVVDLAVEGIDAWPERGNIVAAERMQAITLEIIIRVIFGIRDGQRLAELRPLVARVAGAGILDMFGWTYPVLQRVPPWSRFAAALKRLDQLLYDEIAERRAAGDVDDRTDLLSRMMRPAADGEALTDAELRDQLVTFLLAGHETTATTLSWVLHELAHRPQMLHRARVAAECRDEAGDAVLEAMVKETMRLKPVIFQATRTLTRPVEIAGYTLPAGVVVSPALGLMGTHATHHDDPLTFNPDRFLGNSPAPNTWIPFGGGPRRCIGATFSLMESVEILREILTRYDIEPRDADEDELRPHSIINAPHRGTRLTVSRR